MLPSYFDYIFVHLKQKVRIKPEMFVNFRPESGLNPTRKVWPDLQLCSVKPPLSEVDK